MAECSTPCGVTEFGGGLRRWGQQAQRARCSTPCGVTEFGGSGGLTAATAVSGAQRLAASLNSAEVEWAEACRERAACSTPCGVTEFGGSACSAVMCRSVLCSTPCGVTEFGGRHPVEEDRFDDRAQRLAASLNSAAARRSASARASGGAQRLAASLNSAATRPGRRGKAGSGAQRLAASLNSAAS